MLSGVLPHAERRLASLRKDGVPRKQWHFHDSSS
jgi:hypothetical protein